MLRYGLSAEAGRGRLPLSGPPSTAQHRPLPLRGHGGAVCVCEGSGPKGSHSGTRAPWISALEGMVTRSPRACAYRNTPVSSSVLERAKGDVKRVDGSRQSRGQQRSPCPFWRAELILLCSSEPSSTYNVKSARTVSCTPSFQSTADKWSRAGSSDRARAWPGGRSWLQSVWTWHRASSYPSV